MSFLNLMCLVEILVVYIWKFNIEGLILDVMVVLVGVVVVLILVILVFNFLVCFVGSLVVKYFC